MTVTSVAEIMDGRDTSEDTFRNVTEARHTRAFRVVTDDRHDADLDILGAAEVPKNGDVHPDDPIAFCRGRSASQQDNSPYVWRLLCVYSTGREISNNPLDDAAVLVWNTEQYQREFTREINGDGVVNSAGDPFDPPYVIDDARWAVSVRKNVPAVPAAILSYRNAINSGTFVIDGIPVGTRRGKLSTIHIGEWQVRNDVAYRLFSYILQLKDSSEDDWRPRLLDRGLYEIVGGKPQPIKVKGVGDEVGEAVTTPKQLDGSGVAITNPTAATAIFLTKSGNPELDFNVLPMT